MHDQIQGSDANCLDYLLIKQHETDLISSVCPEDKNEKQSLVLESLGGYKFLKKILKNTREPPTDVSLKSFEASSSSSMLYILT